jgi:phosphatidylserine/phosphatidylglycerophosphate/cardiolipin synthase-like enzyme
VAVSLAPAARLHRKLAHIDGRIAFVGGINIIDDVNTPGQKPPRVDFALRIEGPLLVPIVRTMQRVWAINELVQFQRARCRCFRRRAARSGRRADGEIPDPRQPAPPPRHREQPISRRFERRSARS